ncbi:replication protein P [Pectobacterium zantedeschiae]|uniref:replication protein P n=1 Tax=Pectobacterium zantedeschiae TaxID=2034769 RepID=UPI0032EE5985
MPPSIWISTIGKLSDAQIKSGIGECIRQCFVEGNRYAPDLSDFLSYVSAGAKNSFGLNVTDVMTEFRKYCRTRGQYSCAETYPWRHAVLYWICCDLRVEMIQRNLNDVEIERSAGKKLAAWVSKVATGEVVPEPKPLLSENIQKHKKGKPGEGYAAAMGILSKLRGSKPNTGDL